MPYVGSRDPETVDITVTASDFDLTTVTSVDISVRNPKGVALSWSWSVQSQTTNSLHLMHTFSSDGTDAALAGNYVIGGWLITAGSRRRIKPVAIRFDTY